jgi:hypothetical protein
VPHPHWAYRPRLLHVTTLDRRRVEIFGEKVGALPNPWGYSFWRWDLSEKHTFTFVGDVPLHPSRHARLLRHLDVAVGRGHQVWVASQRGYFREVGAVPDRSFVIVDDPLITDPEQQTRVPDECYFIRRKLQYEKNPVQNATRRAGLDWAMTHLHSAPWSTGVKFKPHHLESMKRAVQAAQAWLATLGLGRIDDPEVWNHACNLMWRELPSPAATPAGHIWVARPGRLHSPDGRRPGETSVALVPLANPYFPSALVMATSWIDSTRDLTICGFTPDGMGFCNHPGVEEPEVWSSAEPHHYFSGPGLLSDLMAQLMADQLQLAQAS